MNDDIHFVDGGGKPDNMLLREYAQMASEDKTPYYLICMSGHWVCMDYLDSERDLLAYYYIHPSGYIGYGAHAEFDARDKGIGAPPPRPLPSQIRPGKYGRLKHRSNNDDGRFRRTR